MKKSIFLFFAAILCAMSISAANMKGGEVLYLKPNSNWTQSNAWFAIYLCNGSSGTTWVKMTKSGTYYTATVPTGDYKNVIFVRMNPSNTSNLDWSQKWNQTADLSFDQKKNCCTITGWDKSSSWSTYQPVSDASLTSSAANIFVGGQATLTAKLSSNANVNTLKSTSYAISPNTGASISGNTFTATAEGTYTVTATVTYYPNGCTSLTSGLKTATATTTIVAEVPAEEVHDVTVSYICGETKLQDPTTVNTVGVETPVKVTAPEIAKYTFANWDLGADVATTDALTSNEINITTKAGGSDFNLVANYEKAKLTYTVTVPAGTENCYLVGAMNGWDVDNPIEMTKQGENVFTTTLEGVATTDEYKYLSKKGSWDYADVQESNRTWTANDVVTAWKDPLATNVHLAGTMTDWDNNKIEFKKATKEATTASIILNLTAGDYKFKIVDNGSWLGNNATIDKTISGWTFASDKGDCPLKATIAGDYTFTWAISTKKLSVTYPTICAITATANDAAMGTIAGAGDYGKGSTATLTATPNDGYLFVNWTKDGVEVATTQEYSFKVTEAVELVANFEAAPEEVHNVTVSYVCGGNKIADDQTVAAVGETTAKTVEAPAIFGYTFSSWTLGAGVTSTDATANPISINIVAGASDFTLTANYTEIPKVTVYFVNNKKWSKVNAYGWKNGEAQGTPAWPGQDITANKETEKIADFDVYSYSVVPGSYDNIIFNNNSGTQTETFKWTDGKYYYMGADKDYAGGTKEEVADKVAVEIPQEAVYFINTGEWKGVNIYGWDGTVAMGWPGIAMNETSVVVNGKEGKVFKVYSHSADQGAYKNIKFNNTENNETQSSNLEWKNGKYYALATGKWYDNLSAAEADLNIYNIKLAGSMTKWDEEAKEFSVTGTTGTLTITLTAGVHEFKIIEDGAWKGNSGTMTRGNRTDWTFDSGDNAKIFAEVAGDYTFSWDATTDKLTVVTYPNSYPAISIVGTMNEWNKATNQSNVVTNEKTSISIDLEAGKLHEFKVAIDTIMLGNEGTMIKSETDWTFEWQKGNAKLTTQAEGTYVFTWNHATHKLSVEYPATTEPLNKLTYTVTVPAGTKKCYIAGDMTSWAFKEMINKGNNVFSIEIEGAIEAHKYKYSASDSWAHQEVKADGSNVDNRTYNAQDVVEKWAEPLVYTVKVPAGTKKCFLAGDMNGWSFTEMTDMGNNTFSIEYGTATSDHKYKYTCKADWAYVEKKNENAEVDNRTYNANDVVERWNRIDIADGENAAIIGSHAGKGKVEVYVDREFKAGQLYTISLPFAVADADGLFGSGTVVYEYADLKYENDEYALYFDNTKNAMEAGKPYLVNPGSDRDGFEYKDTEVVFSEKAISKTVNNTTISMESVMSVTAGATTNGKYWLASDNCLYNVSTALKSLRAVFDIQSSKANVRARVAFGENVETGVDNIVTTDAPVKVIKNGQLIIIRDGVKYNVQGQLVK